MGTAIGIDFGTTNTVVTYKNKSGRYRQVTINGHPLVPSVLYFKSSQDYDFGIQAANRRITDPEGGMASFKMLLGEKHYHIPIRTPNGENLKVKPALAVKLFINKILELAESRLIKEFGSEKGLIDRMVITVPVQFTAVEKESIRKAAMEAIGRGKRSKVRLAFEPTAAAIGAMEGKEEFGSEPVLVYDFGGGTFDISIIRKENGSYRQIYSDGDPKLGGNDLTRTVASFLLDKINDDFGTHFPLDEREFDEEFHELPLEKYKTNIANIFWSANRIKEELSSDEEAGADFNFHISADHSELLGYDLEKDKLEEMLKKQIERTVDITCRAMKYYSDTYGEGIRHLVLAGGSSQIPLVRRLLQERLPGITIHDDDNSATLISKGAAILAQRIDEMENMTRQITSTRIGVSAKDGVQYNKFHMIIPENQPLPCEGSRDFYLAQDGQRSLRIQYYEHDVKANPKAVSVTEEGIREVDILTVELPEGLYKDETVVSVSFKIAADGSMEIGAIVKDFVGNVVQSGNLNITKESDLE